MIIVNVVVAAYAEWVILKNRRFLGKLQEQTVRTKSKPLIMDMEDRWISVA